MSAPEFRFTTRLRLTGEADPQLPARVLGILATLNRLPLDFRCRRTAEDRCQIELCVEGGDEDFLRRLTTQARKIPSVIEARGSLEARAPKTATDRAALERAA